MPSERFDFPNARGQKLSALLDHPAGTPIAYALFAHCFTCGKDNLAAKRIAEGLTARGIAVLRFDFTGLGASEGEDDTDYLFTSTVVISAREEADFATLREDDDWIEIEPPDGQRIWTDDYSNVVGAIIRQYRRAHGGAEPEQPEPTQPEPAPVPVPVPVPQEKPQ